MMTDPAQARERIEPPDTEQWWHTEECWMSEGPCCLESCRDANMRARERSAALWVKLQHLTEAVAHGAEISGLSFEQIVALASAHAEDSGIVDREVLKREAAEAKLEAAEQALRDLIAKWRAEAARVDSFHATMGIGWKVCADDLEASRGEG